MTDEKKNKSGIPPTTIGRERARYAEMRALDGVTDEQVNATVALDAQRYKVDLADYTADINAQPAKRPGSGKREEDKGTRDKLVVETQEMLGPINLAILSARGALDKALTTQQKSRAFDALGANADKLSTHLATCFDGIGGLTMIWSPYDSAENPNPEHILAVHLSGWDDGSQNPRFQYSPRKLPVSKRSGYRDDSFPCPIHGQTVTPEVEAEQGGGEPTE